MSSLLLNVSRIQLAAYGCDHGVGVLQQERRPVLLCHSPPRANTVSSLEHCCGFMRVKSSRTPTIAFSARTCAQLKMWSCGNLLWFRADCRAIREPCSRCS